MIKAATELVDLVIARAAELRGAGVLSLELELGDQRVSVRLSPPTPPSGPIDEGDRPEDDNDNPWFDPTSFGRAKGVPGERRRPDRNRSEK
jgi:hypothetical protein